MASDNLESVMDAWMNDESFRQELRNDPDAAVEARGIQLGAEDKAALRNIDWNQSDEALQQRVSKGLKRT